MINIYAQSLMVATRTDRRNAQDLAAPRRDTVKPRRWLPSGHWWVKTDPGQGDDKL